MRPLECHWKLPDGCFCCFCRPFPVRRLDWPNNGSVSLFREILEELDLPIQINLILLIQLSTRLSGSSCFLLLGSWSRSWSLEWVDSVLCSCISISNFQGMQFNGDHTRTKSSLGFKESFFCSTSSGVQIRTLWRLDSSSRIVTPLAWLIDLACGRGISTWISIMQVLSLSLLSLEGSEFESLDEDSVSWLPGITLMSTELSSLLLFSF